jgi:diacylglycerol kinase (ATP)
MADTTASPTRRAAVVYNPIKIDLEKVRAAVAKAEQAAGWLETSWFETSKEDPGQGAARKALDARVDMVIAEVVAESEASLGLLPSGTGNLLARNLKLTLDDLDNSLDVAFTGEDRAIDLGRIEIVRDGGDTSTHAFVVMAGLGIDAKMLANTDDDLKKRVGWLAYVKAIVETLRDKNQLRFRYRFDDGEMKSIRAHTVIVGNCGALPANIVLLPDAAIDDGVFDVLLMRPDGIRGWVEVLVKVFWENGVVRRLPRGDRLATKEVDSIRYRKVAKMEAQLRDPEDIEIDGDGFGRATGFTTWIEPGALTVRVPQA